MMIPWAVKTTMNGRNDDSKRLRRKLTEKMVAATVMASSSNDARRTRSGARSAPM